MVFACWRCVGRRGASLSWPRDHYRFAQRTPSSHMTDHIARTLGNIEIWRRKPGLRAVYQNLFKDMIAELAEGSVLEIGSGGGYFKELCPRAISTDIGKLPGLDLVVDAQQMPIASGTLGNIVGFDVLHHLEFPLLFLREAQRCLKPGGRLVLVEPGITPVSRIFYQAFHEEPTIVAADPWTEGRPDPTKPPFDANQALPTLIFKRNQARFHAQFPQLRLICADWKSLFAYQLSGGFQPWSLLPGPLARPLLRIERMLLPIVGSLVAFRLMIVVEKLETSAGQDATSN